MVSSSIQGILLRILAGLPLLWGLSPVAASTGRSQPSELCRGEALADISFSRTLNFPSRMLRPSPCIDTNQTATISQQTEASVAAIARLVTVRIFTNPGVGSGAIVARQGDIYTVLTCEHVVADTRDYRYTVLTADGVTHPAEWLRSIRFPDTDLALVQFRSPQSYQVAAIADSKALAVGEPVYASGFPNWHWASENAIQSTRDWALRAFRLTRGTVGMLPERSLPGGYQLGYTNDIENGMSGGPVLDRNGRLIGINGRLKYPLQGISVFAFSDGTMPSEEMFRQMEALSWAVPIARFQQRVRFHFYSDRN